MSSGVAGEQVTDESLFGVPCLAEPAVGATAGGDTAGGDTAGGDTAGGDTAGGLGVAERVAWIAAQVAALHEVLAVDRAWRVGEVDLLQVTGGLVRLRSGVDAAYLRAVAEVDRRRAGASVADGGAAGGGVAGGGVAGGGVAGGGDGLRGARSGIGSSTESFLRTSAPLTPGQAREDVAAARALGPGGSLREMEPQLAAGDITRAHVGVAVSCLDRIPVHLRTEAGDRATIAAYFATLAPTRHALELKQNAAVLLARLAPEVVQRFDPRSHERRFLDWTTDATGMLLGRFALDPTAGATLRAAVDALSGPRPTTDGVRDDRQARERRAGLGPGRRHRPGRRGPGPR